MASSTATSFWQNVGLELGIDIDRKEDFSSFCYRVLFSALSKWVLTVIRSQGSPTSVMRVHQIIRDKCNAFEKILPRTAHIDLDDIEETVYQRLMENGVIYHQQYNIIPAPYRRIHCGKVSLIRGYNPDELVSFSGLAPYIEDSSNDIDFTDAFLLWPNDGETTLDMVWRRSTAVDPDMHFDEYLDVERSSGRYYLSRRSSKYPYAMARNTQQGNAHAYDYYLIMDREVRRIPSELRELSVHDYIRLAMMNRVKKQTVSASIREHVVFLSFGYLLPAPDLRFLRYVSWPAHPNNQSDDRFNFMIHPAIWQALKERLIFLGYEVTEAND